jgi:tight adherence protein B
VFVASFADPIWRFFGSLEHKISPVPTAAIALAVAAVLAYGVLWVVGRFRRPSLAAVLEPYRMTAVAGQAVPDPPPPLITVPWLQRFAARLQALLGPTRLGRGLDNMLERTGSRLRAGELITIWAMAGVIFLALGSLLASLVGFVLVAILVVVLPLAVLQTFVDRRSRLFESQLPDVLKLTASSLRAGFSLMQGLDSVARQVLEPSRGELQRVLAEARLGRPVDEALEAASARIRNRDFSESVVALRIQQETGGNLASLFDTLAETMIQRLHMRRHVRSLTAEGRLSAYILGIMPAALGVFIFVVDRPYELVLFHSTPGKFLLVGGLVLVVVGFFWMYKIVKIEV